MDPAPEQTPPHILILDDDPAHRELCLRAFRDDPDLVRISVAGKIREARTIIEDDPPDLIIADWILPEGKGLDILPRVDGKVTIPLIIMTSHGDEKIAVEIMKSGAIDYVVKSATMFRELPHIARKALRDWGNIQKRKRAETAVLDSQKRIADILSFLPDAVLAIDIEGRVIAWNSAIEKMTGVMAPDMLGKGDYEYSIPFYGIRRPILIDLVQMDHAEIEKKYYFIQRDDDGRITSETFIATLYGGKGANLWGTATPLFDRIGKRIGAIEVIRDITERKKAENILQESEKKFRTLVEQVPDMILVHNNGIIRFINNAAAEVTGYNSKDLIGKSIADFLVPEHRERVIAAMRRRMIGEPVEPYEVTIITKSGQRRDVIVRGCLIDFDESSASLNVLTDITDIRKGEQALAESEKKYRFLIDNVRDVIWQTAPDLTFTYVSPAIEVLIGYPPKDLIGKPLLSLLTEQSASSVRQRLKKRMEEYAGGSLDLATVFEIEMIRHNGSTCWMEVSSDATFGPDHTLTGFHGISRDISERKKTELILRKSERNLLRSQETGHLGSWDWNIPEKSLFWSEELYTIFGVPRDFPQSYESIASLIHPDDRERNNQIVRDFLSDGRDTEYEFRIIRPDGEIRYLYQKVEITMDSSGAPLTVFGIIQDITTRKQAEGALQESETRFRDLFSNMGSGVAIYQPTSDFEDFIISNVNKAVETIEHVKKDEIVGRSVLDVFPGVVEFGLFSVFQRVAQTGIAESHPISMYKDNRISGWRENYIYRLPCGEIVALYDDVTEKKQAEEALQESELKFRTFADYTHDWEYWVLPDGRYQYISPSCERITGYSPDEFYADPDLLKKIIHPDDQLKMFSHTEFGLKEDDAEGSIEFRVIAKDGNTVWIGHICHPLFSKEGEFIGRRGSNRDITVRKKIELTLKESETRFRALIQNSSDIIRILDKDGRITYESDSAERILGYLPGSLIGRYAVEFIHPDDVERVKKDYRDVREKTNPGTPTEFRVRKANGEYVWVEALGANLLDVPGVNGIVITTRPIQQRREAEQALRESEDRLRLALEGADAGFWDWDLITGKAVFSDRFYTMLDYEPGEFPASYESWIALMHPDDRERVLPELQKQIAEKRPNCEIEYRCLSKEGNWIWLLGRGKVVDYDGKGNPARMTGVNIDITNRRLMESEIRSLNTVLEQRVKDRTEALSRANEALEEENAQRVDAEKKLQSSVDEKSMLLKEIHHRVKNNLQIIASLLNLQSRYIKDESTLAAIRESQNRVKAMALVHEKLYRAEDISHISLEDYIKFLGTGLFQFYDAKTRGIQFHLDIHEVNVDINAAIPLGLIINELISNSLKYAFPEDRKGEIVITVKKEEHILTVVFHDTGIGIPAELDWKNTQSLGLRLVNTLVDQMDGTIELDRSDGTKFTMVMHEKV